jgi:cysteate synthase
MGDIPQNYFQGVGSGTGGIAAFEAVRRLVASGRYENKSMRLHLAQNDPFTPIHNAYSKKNRTINSRVDMPQAEDSIKDIRATMLSNRKPPYSIPGGVFDVLERSNGVTYSVTNEQIHLAQTMFKELEGQTIVPEAGAALASLVMASKTDLLDHKESILLNITGGGIQGVARDIGITYPKPRLEVSPDIGNNQIKEMFS